MEAVPFSLWLIFLTLQGSYSAVQRGAGSPPEAGAGGYLPDHLYLYSYSSSAFLYGNINITLEAEVSFQLLSEQDSLVEDELYMEVRDLSLAWYTETETIHDANPIGKMINWFSLVKNPENGGVSSVYHPSNESQVVLAFKKSLSQLVSIGDVTERGVASEGVQTVREVSTKDGGTVSLNKELRYDSSGVLTLANSTEEILELQRDGGADGGGLGQEGDTLFSFPVTSHSTLTLVARQPPQIRLRPEGLVSGSVSVEQIKNTQTLSELSPLISDILHSCPLAECAHQVGGVLKKLDPADIGTLLSRLDVGTEKILVLIDIISGEDFSRGGGEVGVALVELLRSDQTEEAIIERILINLAIGRLTPNQDFVDAALKLLDGRGEGAGQVSPRLQHTALLSLGGMARVLTQHDPQLAKRITDVLASRLDAHASSSRLRRSTGPTSSDKLVHAILLDSAGNSRSPELYTRLVDHVIEHESHVTDHGSLAVMHAAVKAIGRYETEESASFLFHTAESSSHPSISHLAAAVYSTHPRKTRDITHFLSASPHHRSRRQLQNPESAVLNVSMPTVNWNSEFGETNISVGLSRTVRNSFDIDTDSRSSRYTFSLYDETLFDANLLLSSGGPQRTQMWGAEICLQGTATYDINILEDYSHDITARQHQRWTSLVDDVIEDFNDAYTMITESENAYSAVTDRFRAAVDAVPSGLDLVGVALEGYRTDTASIGSSQLKNLADELYLAISVSFSSGDVLTSLSGITEALDDLYPSRPLLLSSSLLVDSLPFTESRFLVRYLPSAPQQAMAGIFNVYRSTSEAFSQLSSSHSGLQRQVDPYDLNSFWLSPLVYFRDVETRLSVLVATIEDTINAADIMELSVLEVADLRSLLAAVRSHLQTTLDLVDAVGDELIAVGRELEEVFAGSEAGFNAFTRAYESSRQQIDIVFGQKFHPNFPREFRSCDDNGCGQYPATSGGMFNEGIDVTIPPGPPSSNVPAPFSGNVQIFNSSLLPLPLQDLYQSRSGYADTSLILIPTETSYTGVVFILANLAPSSSFRAGGETFVTSGDILGSAEQGFLHIEAIKVIDGRGYRLDPSLYLQPRVEPNLEVELECNDVVSYREGLVVGRQQMVEEEEGLAVVARESLGQPLVIDVPNHEFPSTFDLVMRADSSVRSPSEVTYLQTSTFLMVGQVPVQFDFSIAGTYRLDYSLSAGLLSRALHLPVTPSFLARAQGSVRVGSTVFATVDISGRMLETSLPLTLRQYARGWPMVASSSMDTILVPSSLNLTTQLVRLTADDVLSQEILQRETLWSYSIPPLNRNEFYLEGVLVDDTPPMYTPLEFAVDQSGCFVRQLPGRRPSNPAFEMLFDVMDAESMLNVTVSVGTYRHADDIISRTKVGGASITMLNHLVPTQHLFFTVTATNMNGLQGFATCFLPGNRYYDRSVPLARVNPISALSSHPTQIQVLIVLFDEFGFEGVQEVAIGRVLGGAGDGILPWTPFNSSDITTPPPYSGDIMDLFSFRRPGRLVDDIISAIPEVDDVTSCAYICNNHTHCLSFEHSEAESNCILHSNIEGPPTPPGEAVENTFYTTPLQTARSYWHYEKLGVGNSTLVTLPDLSLGHNVVYYVNLRLVNALGYENIISSTGFLVDLTPPLPGLIMPTNVSSERVLLEGCADTSFIPPGCMDGVLEGDRDRVYSDGSGSAVIFNGAVPLSDGRFTRNSNYLAANWNPFSDPESGIFGYTWCIGTGIGLCDVLPHTDPHLESGLTTPLEWTYLGVATDLALLEGAYYITVRATNQITYGGPLFTTVQHITPYMVDATPPTIDDVVDIEYNSSTNQLSVLYTASDGGIGGGALARVDIALGRTSLDTDILEWTLLSDQFDEREEGEREEGDVAVYIPDGIPVWLKLRATDRAGLESVLAHDTPFTVDRTPPVLGAVYDGPILRSDSSFQPGTNTLCVNWAGFSDPDTGIGRIIWSIGRVAGDSQVSIRNLTVEERSRGVACMEGLSLVHNATYFSTLSVYNGAMQPMVVTATSNGVRIDASPPIGGGVFDGDVEGVETSYSSSYTSVSANWNNFRDYESGIQLYTVNIYRSPRDSTVHELLLSESLDGMEYEITRNLFQFQDGDFVFVEVLGVNGAGVSVGANSSGVTIDFTPPTLSYIVDGGSPSEDTEYQASNTSLVVSWEVNDLESGVTTILGTVYQVRDGGTRMRVYPTSEDGGEGLPSNTTIGTWMFEGLELQSGSRYVVSLTIFNGAGLLISHETNGVIIDPTPPNVLYVRVSSDAYLDTDDTGDTVTMVADPNQTESRWLVFDFESGIQSYNLGVVDENGALLNEGYEIFDGSETAGLIQTPPLSPGGLYRVVLIAINNAGLESEEAFSEPFRVAIGDNAGNVLDGSGPDDYDFTDEITAITASFSGFSSEGCGGIVRYTWAVGTEEEGPGREDVVRFTSQGVVDYGDGPGHAQLPVPGLRELANQKLYITVRGMTGCGRVLESISNGFVIDTTPPSLEITATGRLAIERAQREELVQHEPYQSSELFSSIWEVTDRESGINDDVIVDMGTFPGGRDLATGRRGPYNYIRDEVMSGDGIPTYVTVTASNGAGVMTTDTSEPITLDRSPPIRGEITCTTIGYTLPLSLWSVNRLPFLSNNSGQFLCRWEGVVDPESRISQYIITIGTSPTDQSVFRRVIPGGYTSQSSFTTPVLYSLIPSLPYHVTLSATNNAGLVTMTTSGPVYFDISPPIMRGGVVVRPNFKVADYIMGTIANVSLGVESASCLLDTDTVSLTFELPEDAESSTSRFMYQIGIGYSQGSDDFVNYAPFEPLPLPVTNDNHPLSSSILYHRLVSLDFSPVGRRGVYFSVRVFNGGNQLTLLTSKVVYIKSELTMEQNWIFDGINTEFDIEYQTSMTEIGSSFYFGVNCPIRRGRWAVEGVDGNLTQAYVDLDVDRNRDPLENLFRVSTDQVDLFNDETYRVTVQVTDETGEVYIMRSDGVTVTTLGLVPGIVRDGSIPEQDLNYQESVTTLWACWSGFGDGSPEQEIAYYEVAVGSDVEFPSTRSNIAAYTNVGLNNTHTFTGLDLVAEREEYLVTVRAYSVSGAFMEAHSNGIRVGLGHSIIPGVITLPRYQGDGSTLSSYWSDFESTVPIRQYEWALGARYYGPDELEDFCSDINSDYRNYFDVSGFTSVDQDTHISLRGLALQDNTTYYLYLRVLDQAGKCITVTTPEGVTIDMTPPILVSTPVSVLVGPVQSRVPESDFVVYVRAEEEELSVEWETFQDDESGIEFYEVGIFSLLECSDDTADIDFNSTDIESVLIDFVMVLNVEVRMIEFSNVPFLPDIPYLVVVQATNRAGVAGQAHSQPILLDTLTPFQGTVKDGPNWRSDLTYQSDLSMLSAIFAHAQLPPAPPTSSGVAVNGPCPDTAFFELFSLDSSWKVPSSPSLVGYASSTLVYRPEQVSPSSSSPSPLGISITTVREQSSVRNEVVSGAYQSRVDLSEGGVFQGDILASSGSLDFQDDIVTAVVFVDSGSEDSDLIPKFEPDAEGFDFSENSEFSAFGLQIYRASSIDSSSSSSSSSPSARPQRVVMWSQDSTTLGEPVFISRDIPGVDLSSPNEYRIRFINEQLDFYPSRMAELYINDLLIARLHGLPALLNSTRIVLYSFNLRGFVPPPGPVGTDFTTQAVFANITLPSPVGHLCDYGVPFHSRESPIVEFRAGVGTEPGLSDVSGMETIFVPCVTCLPGGCQQYRCNTTCTLTDPYTIPTTFTNLTLSPGYPLPPGDRSSTPSDDASSSFFDALTSTWFQPATYYITVEAVTASGRRVYSVSNGVTMDTSPPQVVALIEHFDTSFSSAEPVRFQGNNNTISSRWAFSDPQSDIIDHTWAIGTTPFGSDVRGYVPAGLSNVGVTEGLALVHNTTYYVTVVAKNGAGLTTNLTSGGVTYIATELDVSLLATLVEVEFTVILTFRDEESGQDFSLRETDRDDQASVSWEGIPEDIEEISWFIGSLEGMSDILPPVVISQLNPEAPFMAAIDGGVLSQGSIILANVSEVIALAEGKPEDMDDNSFFFEPGRVIYHSIEFCNFVHVCTQAGGTPSIVIRPMDEVSTALFSNTITKLEESQSVGVGVNRMDLHPLDKEYSLSLETNRGLNRGSMLYTGFLNQEDVTKTYRVATPYISNPFLTMGLTSRDIARRFTEFGGPSFFVSFLGQDSLNAPLDLNVTFDSSLDWEIATPEIAYWDVDVGVWREVSETCMNASRVDYITSTIAVRVCSTLFSEEITPSPTRPRQRRQADSNPLNSTLLTSGSGMSGDGMVTSPPTTTTTTSSVLRFLDRPIQFIVMRIGNESTNSAPRLLLPAEPLMVVEDTPLSVQLEYSDAELDAVDFDLQSVSRYGNVTLSSSGLLTFDPCRHCTGTDVLAIRIREQSIGDNHVPLSDMGQVIINIGGVNDGPVVYFHEEIAAVTNNNGVTDGNNSNAVTSSNSITVYIDSNRTSPVSVARISALDFDGSSDALRFAVLQDGESGAAGFQTLTDALNLAESLPITLPEGLNQELSQYQDYVTFLQGHVTYLPSDPTFVGRDQITIVVQDVSNIRNEVPLSITIKVLPSLCVNGGVCGGSEGDPECVDYQERRINPGAYNCTCPRGYEGQFCEVSLALPEVVPVRDCLLGVPVVMCDGDPCLGAMCPSNTEAECRPSYCGSCKAEWYVGDQRISCNADNISNICFKLIPNAPNEVIIACNGVSCECPLQPYSCPEDSILVENRVDDCCVTYECTCPNISCPLIMEGRQMVQPIPNYRGNQFPGRCCPDYRFEDINECQPSSSENLCSDGCSNLPGTYSCQCPVGRTLARDGINCGVCPYNEMEYLLGDRVKIGCNWCVCQSDTLSGERWHCTASSCDDGCLSNGMLYPVGAAVLAGQHECLCEPTGLNDEDWMCQII